MSQRLSKYSLAVADADSSCPPDPSLKLVDLVVGGATTCQTLHTAACKPRC